MVEEHGLLSCSYGRNELTSWRKEEVMRKRIHPADAFNDSKIADAEYFVATLFIGRGTFLKYSAESLEQARAFALILAANEQGRPPVIYAILNDGTQALVPDTYCRNATS